ncbi:GNAT family N-acetyltransferase [Actinoplanes sp. DH11]|uniref:GNAT family N-acetyltransferase n=1 Tax=Actinoplanes sp. DH11 TaxID=2857011 RepID=UPI001E5F0A00|nr:GNAT family N-acetyltransferase [Actinoplanes sp. DH11]
MRETVTYVDMATPGQLVPAAPVPGLTLEPLDRSSPWVIDLQVRIGAPHGWKCATRTPEQWATWAAEHPDRLFWLLSYEGTPAGLVAYDLHPQSAGGAEVEIETFGLVPEFVGRGLGGHALTLALRQAWELTAGVSRIWLHTSSADHPNALPNYHRRGLRTFRTEERTRD